MPHSIAGGENKVGTMLISAVNITAQKTFIDYFLSYSVELKCMLNWRGSFGSEKGFSIQ